MGIIVGQFLEINEIVESDLVYKTNQTAIIMDFWTSDALQNTNHKETLSKWELNVTFSVGTAHIW